MNSLSLAHLSEPARKYLALCQDGTLAGHEKLARFLEASERHTDLVHELRPVADRAARTTLNASLLSFLLAVSAAYAYFRHSSPLLTGLACGFAVAALLWAGRLSARQGLLDTALLLPLPLPESGAMSRQTVLRLVHDVSHDAAAELADTAKPLCQAHLALARALAREHRHSGR